MPCTVDSTSTTSLKTLLAVGLAISQAQSVMIVTDIRQMSFGTCDAAVQQLPCSADTGLEAGVLTAGMDTAAASATAS